MDQGLSKVGLEAVDGERGGGGYGVVAALVELKRFLTIWKREGPHPKEDSEVHSVSLMQVVVCLKTGEGMKAVMRRRMSRKMRVRMGIVYKENVKRKMKSAKKQLKT